MADLEQLPDAAKDPVATESTAGENTTSSKKKRKKRPPKKHVLSQFTIRNPPWAYVHLQRLTTSTGTQPDLDAVTAQLYITSALSQFLGLHGAAIPFDILKITGQDLWIRLPAEGRSALVAAVGGWVSSSGEGWSVTGWSSWDASAESGNSRQNLFAD